MHVFVVEPFAMVQLDRTSYHDAGDDDADGIYNLLPKAYCLWDHRLGLVADTRPSIRGNRIYMRTVCHALLS